MTTYVDKVKCPEGHVHQKRRRLASAGFKVATFCPWCDKSYNLLAGPVPGAKPAARKLREADIEAYLVKRVFQLGGEVRKVKWIGRNGAPDRLVMLPPAIVGNGDWTKRDNTIWVELKAPGLAPTFPKNAHEKAQHREHERMRKMGQRVEVVDSYERIEEVLK